MASPAARVALLSMIGVGFLPSLIRHSHGRVGKRSLHISQKSQFLVTCRRPPVAPRLCLNPGSMSSNFQEITRRSSPPRDMLQRTHRGCCMMPSPLLCFFPASWPQYRERILTSSNRSRIGTSCSCQTKENKAIRLLTCAVNLCWFGLARSLCTEFCQGFSVAGKREDGWRTHVVSPVYPTNLDGRLLEIARSGQLSVGENRKYSNLMCRVSARTLATSFRRPFVDQDGLPSPL